MISRFRPRAQRPHKIPVFPKGDHGLLVLSFHARKLPHQPTGTGHGGQRRLHPMPSNLRKKPGAAHPPRRRFHGQSLLQLPHALHDLRIVKGPPQPSNQQSRTSRPLCKPVVRTACNLCHLDKTLEWTGQNLAAWYKIPVEELSPEDKSIAASVLWALKGDAGQRALIAWHMGWQPPGRLPALPGLPPILPPCWKTSCRLSVLLPGAH